MTCEKLWNLYSKEILHGMFIVGFHGVAGCWRQPKCSSLETGISKLWQMCTVKNYIAAKNVYQMYIL